MKKIMLPLFLFFSSTLLFAQTQPNIILIMFDDMNDWVQGFNGHPQTTTPNWKWVENKGTTFTNAYTNAPQCAPSRTSMISGKDLYYTNVYTNNDLVCDNFRENFTADLGNETVFTLPEILKDSAGYFTYSIGKIMHCQEKFPDYDSVSTDDDCERKLSWNKIYAQDDEGGDTQIITDYGSENDLGTTGFAYSILPDSLESEMIDYIVADKTIEFINNYAGNPDNYCNKPFFLGVGFRRPHSPNYIPESYWSPYRNEDYYSVPFDLPYDNPPGPPFNGIVMPPQPTPIWDDFYNLPEDGVAVALANANPVHLKLMQWGIQQTLDYGYPFISDTLSDDERLFIMEESKRANMVMSYLASIKFVDAQLGRIISTLQLNPEILNNSIIILTSDHGYSLGEKQHWKKGALWETDIRVPLVIADLRTPAKKVCKRFISLIDLYPTICDLAGVDYPTFSDGSNYLDGSTLTPLLINPGTPFSKPVLTSYRNTKNVENQGSCFPNYSVRNEEWHYIRYSTNGDYFPDACDEATSVMQEELYHIGKKKNIDPYEWDNLAEDPAYDYIKEDLATYLPGGINYLQFIRTNNEIIIEQEENNFFEFPNPASEFANFRAEELQQGPVVFSITDITGRIITQINIHINEDNFLQLSYPINELSEGYYLAQIKQGAMIQNLSFIVAH